jgi:hypothetical protein
VVNVKILSHEHHAASCDDFNDPAGWNAASYVSHPADSMEPIEVVPSEYRQCALALLEVLSAIDSFMCKVRPRKPPKKWMCVSLALGLSSTRGQTETSVALEYGVSRSVISQDVVKLLRLAGLEDQPAFGLKSVEDRRTFMRTNGRRLDKVADTNSTAAA